MQGRQYGILIQLVTTLFQDATLGCPEKVYGLVELAAFLEPWKDFLLVFVNGEYEAPAKTFADNPFGERVTEEKALGLETNIEPVLVVPPFDALPKNGRSRFYDENTISFGEIKDDDGIGFLFAGVEAGFLVLTHFGKFEGTGMDTTYIEAGFLAHNGRNRTPAPAVALFGEASHEAPQMAHLVKEGVTTVVFVDILTYSPR